jgi:hypothetical protein
VKDRDVLRFLSPLCALHRKSRNRQQILGRDVDLLVRLGVHNVDQYVETWKKLEAGQ